MALIDFRGSPHGGMQKHLPEWQSQPRITPTTIIDHSIVGSGLGAWNMFKNSSSLESHFIVLGRRSGSNDGMIWQLMDTGRQGDANLRANGYALSIETEDDGDPDRQPWTNAQLQSLAWLHDELRRVHPTIPRRESRSCSDPGGLGYHTLHGAPSCWTPVSKSCPGIVRRRQWRDTLLPAYLTGIETEPEKEWWEMPIPETELEKIEATNVEALMSTAGQAALRKAFEAEVSEIVAATGANQFFVKQEGTPQVYVVGHGGELYHIPNQSTLFAMGGTDALKRILEYPADADIWRKVIHGQPPGPVA